MVSVLPNDKNYRTTKASNYRKMRNISLQFCGECCYRPHRKVMFSEASVRGVLWRPPHPEEIPLPEREPSPSRGKSPPPQKEQTGSDIIHPSTVLTSSGGHCSGLSTTPYRKNAHFWLVFKLFVITFIMVVFENFQWCFGQKILTELNKILPLTTIIKLLTNQSEVSILPAGRIRVTSTFVKHLTFLTHWLSRYFIKGLYHKRSSTGSTPCQVDLTDI